MLMFAIKKINVPKGTFLSKKIPWVHYGYLVKTAVMMNNQEIVLDLLRNYDCSAIPFYKREKLVRSFPNKELGDIMSVQLLQV